jgi:hypothetical protein
MQPRVIPVSKMDGLEYATPQQEMSPQEITYLCIMLALLVFAFLFDAWNQRARRFSLVR